MVVLPSRPVFWRMVLLAIALFSALSLGGWVSLAQRLGVNLPASPAWIFLFTSLGALCALALLGLALSFRFPNFLAWFEFGAWARGPLRLVVIFSLPCALLALPALTIFLPGAGLLAGQGFTRGLVFTLSGLLAANGLAAVWRKPFPFLFVAALMLAALIHRVGIGLANVTTYPFSMGWSETSRFYWPSLFLSPLIYGERLPWPILHPTLHLWLVPPYLLESPLWLHRAWQEFLRIGLLAALTPFLLARLRMPGRAVAWAAALWMTLSLLIGPVYYHLIPPVMLVLWGYDPRNPRKTWLALLLASAYCGWSRVNWWPMPGMLVAVLYLMETPRNGPLVNYLLRPAAFFLVGVAMAFAAQRGYIALSGIANPGDFYTSFTSALLWYRLLPNASYPLGIVPGLLLFSLPVWVLIGIRIRSAGWDRLRATLIFMALAVLLAGGAVVSLKIGGGIDLHNLDAYWVMLLVVASTLFFGAKSATGRAMPGQGSIHWLVVAAVALVPVWFSVQGQATLRVYDPARAQQTLDSIQRFAQNAEGETLFITQRHLIAMGMLNSVSLMTGEYEREELMEMAMAQNEPFLTRFEDELRAHRFALIVADPLRLDTVGNNYSLAEEQNVWNRFIARPILRFYCPVFVSVADRVALYAPRVAGAACLP